MGSKSAVRQIANVVLPQLGAVGGAANGIIQGDGINGAVKGGLSAGLNAAGQILGAQYLAPALGVSNALGSGIGGALSGAASGAIKGDGALKGAAIGGAGGYLTGGGGSDIAKSLGFNGLTGQGSLLGEAGTSWLNPDTGVNIAGAGGSGVLGTLNKGAGSIANVLTGSGGGGSSFGGLGGAATLASVLGGVNSLNANKKAKNELTNAGEAAIQQLQPYQATGTAANAKLADLLGTSGNTASTDYGALTKPFQPGDLTQDPGYQFQLEQGNQAIDRTNAARGGFYSGAALKDAAQFAQGLSDQTYGKAYDRYTQDQNNLYGKLSGQSAQGLNAAGGAAGITTDIGSAKANAGINSASTINSLLASVLAGSGARKPVYGTNGQIIGYA